VFVSNSWAFLFNILDTDQSLVSYCKTLALKFPFERFPFAISDLVNSRDAGTVCVTGVQEASPANMSALSPDPDDDDEDDEINNNDDVEEDEDMDDDRTSSYDTSGGFVDQLTALSHHQDLKFHDNFYTE